MATKINYTGSIDTTFKEVEEGEIFDFNGNLFIRTEKAVRYSYDDFNAVCLYDGTFKYFENCNKVKKVDVEINVKFI